jgi:hypothetical protein
LQKYKYQKYSGQENNRTNRKEASQTSCKQLNQTKKQIYPTNFGFSERLVSSEAL